MRFKPFQALRPSPALASAVAALPYDVVSTAEARALAAGNPNSFFHVSRPEIDLPEGTDPHSGVVYAQAASAFARFRKEGILRPYRRSRFHIYRQRMGGHDQYGVVGCFHADDYASGIVRRHERTRADKEEDRLRHLAAIRAHSGPVFLTYHDSAEVNACAEETCRGTSLFDFTAPDGIRHTVWEVSDSEAVERAFAPVPRAYIADGHHRCAAAARYAAERRAENPSGSGPAEHEWILGVMFPASQLRILPYNRLVRDLAGRSPSQFLAALGQRFALKETRNACPEGRGRANLYLGGKWYDISLPAPPAGVHPRPLDVAVLQETLLGPILGIDDPRTSQRIDFVGGIRGTAELARRVDAGDWAVAVSMYPVSIDDVMAYADADAILPPKSTWFEPKLRSGLLVHAF